VIKEFTEQKLSEAKIARAKLEKLPTTFLGASNVEDYGLYLQNYANCLMNRQIDIFDDSIFLLDYGKISSACTISRGMIETYAFAKLLSQKIAKVLANNEGSESIEKSKKLILGFTNSSRIKQSHQKKVKEGTFKLDDYHFTDQDKDRMGNMLAGSEHVMNALRSLYEKELEHTKAAESGFEQTYDVLSEWVHPSQTSVFHYYVKETHIISTSVGDIHFVDSAKAACARALHFITDSMNIYNGTIALANELSNRSNQNS
jgi:hypothetical protein